VKIAKRTLDCKFKASRDKDARVKKPKARRIIER